MYSIQQAAIDAHLAAEYDDINFTSLKVPSLSSFHSKHLNKTS
jgi:hypothetical protein